MKIFTFNSRGYVLWEVMQSYLNLSYRQMHAEISSAFQGLLTELGHKRIDYAQLKNVLTPQKDKLDICLVFDSTKIDDAWYGNVVFKHLLPLISKFDKVSVSVGDLIGENETQEAIYYHFKRQLVPFRDVEYRHSTQFFLVHLNCMNPDKVGKLTEGLSELPFFTGYFDFTFSSPLKSLVSATIGQQFIILGDKAITESEYQEEVADYNMYGYPFEENGLKPTVISDVNYNSFLVYKIEREVWESYSSDQVLSLAAITEKPSLLDDFEVVIEPEKMEYLRREKNGTLSVSGINKLTEEEFSALIKKKINSNYYFNLDFLEEHNVLKFNIIIELVGLEERRPIRYLVALELLPDDKKLRVITLY